MLSHTLIDTFFIIFSSAAILATFVLYTRQPIIVSYVVLGAFFGPYGFKIVNDTKLLGDIAHAGIILLLFLLGLEMHPRHFARMLRKVAISGIISALVFAVIGYGCALLFSFPQMDCLLIGVSMMFSSTIIGIKLLPSSILRSKHTGELLVSQLLLQDFLAIIVLLCLYNSTSMQVGWHKAAVTLIALPVLTSIVFILVKVVLLPLMIKFHHFQEYLFLLTIGWCLGVAEIASMAGLSSEIGAFIAGVSIATSQVSDSLAANLKPLRDFFLVLFFFSIGAGFNLMIFPEIWPETLLLVLVCLCFKPLVFGLLLKRQSEKKRIAWEIGLRLGQNSEFSILIAIVASSHALISDLASCIIQATAILTLMISSYIVVLNLPTPISVSNRLRRD